jgi:hypothetical protein
MSFLCLKKSGGGAEGVHTYAGRAGEGEEGAGRDAHPLLSSAGRPGITFISAARGYKRINLEAPAKFSSSRFLEVKSAPSSASSDTRFSFSNPHCTCHRKLLKSEFSLLSSSYFCLLHVFEFLGIS